MIARSTGTSNGGAKLSLGQMLGRTLVVGISWLRTAQDRRRLGQLSDQMLKDIGLTRADVHRELMRPFWQPIDHRGLDQQRRLSARRAAKA